MKPNIPFSLVVFLLTMSPLSVFAADRSTSACGLPALTACAISQEDDDNDGIINAADNCRHISNPMQTDTNGDGYGNKCDADFDGNGAVNFVDYTLLTENIFQNMLLEFDLNDDGNVDFVDASVFASFFEAEMGSSDDLTDSFIDYFVSVEDHGIIAGNVSAAHSNTLAFRSLVAPIDCGCDINPMSAGFCNNLEACKDDCGVAPNPTSKTILFSGGQTYFFNDVIPIDHETQTTIDLCGSTLHFSKTPETSDQGVGFIHALAGLQLENGRLELDYTGSESTPIHAGSVIRLGTRSSIRSANYFCDVWDGQLENDYNVRMGDVTLRNLEVSSNYEHPDITYATQAIGMLGGLQNVCIDNVSIDGQFKLDRGIAYEFGFGEPPSGGQPGLSSHAHNMTFKNVSIQNLSESIPDDTMNTEAPKDVEHLGIRLGGSYDVLIENLIVDGADTGLILDIGEAMFYRPWSYDPIEEPFPTKENRHITVVNTTMYNVTNGISLTGSGSPNTGYLSSYGLVPTPDESTELVNYEMTGLNLYGGTSGTCIACRGAKFKIYPLPNADLVQGFNHSVRADRECTNFDIRTTRFEDASSVALRLGFEAGQIYPERRRKTGIIQYNSIRRNVGAAITLDYTSGMRLYDNAFGDMVTEPGQTVALSVNRSFVPYGCRENETLPDCDSNQNCVWNPDEEHMDGGLCNDILVEVEVEPVPDLCDELPQTSCDAGLLSSACAWDPENGCVFVELKAVENRIDGQVATGPDHHFKTIQNDSYYDGMVLQNNSSNANDGDWIVIDE